MPPELPGWQFRQVQVPETRAATSPVRDAAVQSATAHCRRGTVAVGGSAVVNGAPAGAYHVTAVWPRGRDLTVEARALRTLAPWSVTATAVCVASRELPSLQVQKVSAQPRGAGDSFGVADAYCAAGKRLAGLGWRITDDASRLQSAQPDQSAPANSPSEGEFGDKPNAASVFAYVPGKDGPQKRRGTPTWSRCAPPSRTRSSGPAPAISSRTGPDRRRRPAATVWGWQPV
jgi:hypothetical protein